ncbi:MAG TPA: phosphate ABC transporter permease PstA [Aggregatilineales bacterium]|nr:phosphate ABC transporter permease PstA [Aggregatilineales bacterium]
MAQATTFTRKAVSEGARSVREQRRLVWRKATNGVITVLFFLFAVIAVGVLVAIIGRMLTQAIPNILSNPGFFTQSGLDGGIAQDILGTLELLAMAAVIAVPLGIAVAIYLSEYKDERLTEPTRFVMDLLAQTPSIIVGLVVYTLFISHRILPKSGLVGAIALAVIMLPFIARTVEEILHLVPDTLREAGLALGTPRWRVALRVVIPTVLPGIMTGVVLSLARVAGETAPLIFITYSFNINFDPMGQMGYITGGIYQDAVKGDFATAWSATLVLMVVIAAISLTIRYLTSRGRGTNNA